MKKQLLIYLCMTLCTSTIFISFISGSGQENITDNASEEEEIIPIWQQEMTRQVMKASQQISNALPLLPDDTPESIEETKQRIKHILVTQPTFFQAWLRLAELLEEFPLDTPTASFNVEQFRENIEQLIGYLETIVQEELTEEERVALAEIQSSTRFILSDSPATSDSGSGGDWLVSAMNAAWKLVGAFAVLYIGYSVVDAAKQKKKLDDIAFKEAVDKVDKKWDRKLKDLRKELQTLETQQAQNSEHANQIVSKEEAEALIKEHKQKIKALETLRRETHDLRKAIEPHKPGLFGRFLGHGTDEDEQEEDSPIHKKASKKKKRRSLRLKKHNDDEDDDAEGTTTDDDKEKSSKKKKTKKKKDTKNE